MYRSDWTANTDRQMRDEYGGVGYYRIVKVAEQVKKAGYDVDVVGAKFTRLEEGEEKRFERIFVEYDVLWICYTAHSYDAATMFYLRDKFKKKVIIDLDDNYLDVVDSHRLYDRLKAGKRERAMIGTALSFADAITVSTEPLKQRLQQHFKEVYNMEKDIYVLPNFNDAKDWNYKKVAKNKDKIVIGYAGSNSHDEDLKMIMPHLGAVMNTHKNVYFETCGAIEIRELVNLGVYKHFSPEARTRFDLKSSTSTFKEYPKMLSEQKWDIALAPLADNAFTRCKSHIKWFEMSMFKFPVIASRVYPYYVDLWDRKVIEHDVTGLLVKPHEWTDALEDLILHKEKRIKLGENAYKTIKERWQYDTSGMSEVIDKILKGF